MAIIQNRLSTEVVDATLLDPDIRNRATYKIDYESGPVALNDTSLGLDYQTWTMTYNGGDFIATPELSGLPQTIINVPDVEQLSFCFDQNAHITIVYIVGTSAFLYWYDTLAADWVTTEFVGVKSAMLSLDDKRTTQFAANDMLFYYTRLIGGGYSLYHRRQRDRFLDEIWLADNCYPYVFKAGMHDELRGKIVLAGSVPTTNPPIEPPGPSLPQANLDFELGDVYWEKTGGFIINTDNPYAGSWSSRLDVETSDGTTFSVPNCNANSVQRQFSSVDADFVSEGVVDGSIVTISNSTAGNNGVYTVTSTNVKNIRVAESVNYESGATLTFSLNGGTPPPSTSELENSIYSSFTPEDPVFISCILKGTEATQISLGVRFYNTSKTLVSTSVSTKPVSLAWTQVVHSVTSPPNAVYARIYVKDNNTAGIVSLDNFRYYQIVDTGTFYSVELGATLYAEVELDATELFEVEV